jgi:4-hydroxy-3-polyprenylbenzoate decarboxylase
VEEEIGMLNAQLNNKTGDLESVPLIVVCDDARFAAATLNNFLWITFTRCNPSHDIHGINSFVKNKHWSCSNIVIDARIKPHHAPPVEKDTAVENKIDRLFKKGGSLYNIS